MGDLILAVPSKGRLKENCDAFFAAAGLPIAQPGGARTYRGTIKGLPEVEIAFLSASDIASELAGGGVHFGVTGEDLVRETIPDAPSAVVLLAPLGFGHADVVVAVPQAWIDVRGMADLDDVAETFRARHGRRIRVATKYFRLTRAFFAHHGISDYRIVESLGATEGAPASGAADLIVDITSSGATLRANSLRVLDDGVMLRSQANLVASVRAAWSEQALSAAETILKRMAAQARADTVREIRATVADQARVARVAVDSFGARIPFGAVGGTGALVLHCPRETVWDCVHWLETLKAETVTVARLDYVFESHNPLMDRLMRRLESAGITSA